jgi:hypothetical protein
MRSRLHYPQPAHRVVAREDDYLHPLVRITAFVVKGQQFFHQGKRHTRRGWCVQALALQVHIGAVIALFKHLVFFFKVEQRARRNRHYQFAVQGRSHGFA